MLFYVIKRLLFNIPVLLGISFLLFFMLRMIPGDPAQVLAGEVATQEDIELIRHELGLDRPIYVQYAVFLGRLVRFDFGRSAKTQHPVILEIWARLPNTILLAVVAITLACLFGIPAGVISAVRPYSWLDYLVTSGALFGISMPVFWLGLMMIVVFSIWLHWLPAGGIGTWKHVVLPSITLRNALIPIITVVGLQFGLLLGGAVLTESVFAWPGLGRLIVDSILARDYPITQGAILIFGLLYVLVNLIVDLLYALIDPRIHYE